MSEKVACKTCERWRKVDMPNPGTCPVVACVITSGDDLVLCGDYRPKPPSVPAGTADEHKQLLEEVRALRAEVDAIRKIAQNTNDHIWERDRP